MGFNAGPSGFRANINGREMTMEDLAKVCAARRAAAACALPVLRHSSPILPVLVRYGRGRLTRAHAAS